ncbi:Protein lin-28 A [Liparis tanakae]|uniref:Protein lin-28 A n=1 Tax=Liparis tanakae TaxID=230148 RepID=A0A4Z2E5U0_9TELE|nr:Protein lin-28 A [Liparis tanakae]
MGSASIQSFTAGRPHSEEEEEEEAEEEEEEEEEKAALSRGSGVCKWFNLRMGFGFLSMSNRDGTPLEEPQDVFVHQVRRPHTFFT